MTRFAPALLAAALAGCPAAPPVPAAATPRPVATPALPIPARWAGGPAGDADGALAELRFREPSGLDVDAAGNLYVADAGNHRIRKIAPDGTGSTVAGSAAGSADGPAADARFEEPLGVACLPLGGLLVADGRGRRVRALDVAFAATTRAGTGDAGDQDGAGAEARFQAPSGLAVDALGAAIVADAGGHRLRQVARDGRTTTLTGGAAGYQDGPLGAARFRAPGDVAIDGRGRIYVADVGNHAIRVVDLAAGEVRTLAGDGTAGERDGAGGEARFAYPTGLAVDAAGALYVADSQNLAVRKAYPDGRVVTLARAPRPATGEPACVPTDVAVLPDGRIVVSDSRHHALFMVAP